MRIVGRVQAKAWLERPIAVERVDGPLLARGDDVRVLRRREQCSARRGVVRADSVAGLGRRSLVLQVLLLPPPLLGESPSHRLAPSPQCASSEPGT